MSNWTRRKFLGAGSGVVALAAVSGGVAVWEGTTPRLDAAQLAKVSISRNLTRARPGHLVGFVVESTLEPGVSTEVLLVREATQEILLRKEVALQPSRLITFLAPHVELSTEEIRDEAYLARAVIRSDDGMALYSDAVEVVVSPFHFGL